MKNALVFLFGNLGRLISAVLMSFISWFTFPFFIQIVTGRHILSNVVGYIFVCPFILGLLLSSVASSCSLIIKGAIKRQWIWFALGLVIFLFDIALIIVSAV